MHIHYSCIQPLELLTDYISYARANVHPKISDEAVNGLIEGYIAMRQFGAIGGQKVISATTRQLESLIRVSEALARMRYVCFLYIHIHNK